MFVQIDKDNNLVAWGGYPFEGSTHQVDVDYDDYINNPDKYIYIKDTQEIILNPEWATIALKQEKGIKIEENDTKRDERLASGVSFKNYVFDCDTDQKANLMGASQFMAEGETITWFAMDNEPVKLTKDEMIELGKLIMDTTTKVWTENANIKYQIAEAKNIAEVKKIFIDYSKI